MTPQQLLTLLLDAFPARRDASPESAAAYVLAIDGCSVPALQRAVKEFIRGEVPDQSPKFPPTPAELAQRVRYCAARIEWEARPETPPERQIEVHRTEAERLEMKKRMDALSQSVAAKLLAPTAQQEGMEG